MADLEPRDIPEEVHELEIVNPVTFLQSFRHDPSVGHRIPPQRLTPMTIANFTRKLFEPYIVRDISNKTALRPVASCSPRPLHVPCAYNVNSSSGCFRPGSFRPGATFFCPDAPGAPWRSLPSNHTPSVKPLPPAAPEAPVRLPPPPEAFRPRILSSQTRPVPSLDTPLPLNLSQTLP